MSTMSTPKEGYDIADDDLENSPSSPPLPHVTTTETPLHSMPNDFRAALDEFRHNWQCELKDQREKRSSSADREQKKSRLCETDVILSTVQNAKKKLDADQQQMLAEDLFHKAVELEQRGKVYDALPLYRKAVQMVPDIEFKYYEQQKLNILQSGEKNGAKPLSKDFHGTKNSEDDDELIEDLYEKFQFDLANEYGGKLLLSNRDANVISTELHISDLPTEILLYILRWVVSSDLDMRSLEHCAEACKGMYLCAHDEDLWRLACAKVWGKNVGDLNCPIVTSTSDDIIDTSSLKSHPVYSSWRQMFIERDRVLFNGCYISKTTYLRMGENSFQDQYYRPVQLVEYYRYVRFLPDGTVVMRTSADEPVNGVTKLKNIQYRTDILTGHYHLYGDTVKIVVRKPLAHQRVPTGYHQYSRQRRESCALTEENNAIKYSIEFRIISMPRRRHIQLNWLHYSIVRMRFGVEAASTEFDLSASKYPPLWFSPVRSYHKYADTPLA